MVSTLITPPGEALRQSQSTENAGLELDGSADAEQRLGLVPGDMPAARVFLHGLVGVRPCPAPREVFHRVQHLNLQIKAVRQHDLGKFGVGALPVLEVVTFLGQPHRTERPLVGVVGQRDLPSAIGEQPVRHVAGQRDVLLECGPSLLVR